MKKILVIGSTVVDMIINVDKLPNSKGDTHIKSQKASMGGCAYNVADTINNYDVPNILFSPVGSGIYGDFVRNGLRKKGLISPIPPVDMDNGCCYCFVEENGERTFISYHGAEYLIYKKWLDEIDIQDVGSVYICGLEIEEKTGSEIVAFLEEHKNLPIFFAPGPRILKIDEGLLDRLYRLNPVLHLNFDEALAYTGVDDVQKAAQLIYEKSNNTVIITLGEEGAVWYDGVRLNAAAGYKAETVVDTIGAGDSHIGAIMAELQLGSTMEQAIDNANKIARAVVATDGALLDHQRFEQALKRK